MRIAITGVTGRLGGALARHHRTQGHEVIPLDRQTLDLSNPDQLPAKLASLEFDAFINPAALTSLEGCEDHRGEAQRTNGLSPGTLAKVCRERGVPFIHVSTDYVFGGDLPRPHGIRYRGSHQPLRQNQTRGRERSPRRLPDSLGGPCFMGFWAGESEFR